MEVELKFDPKYFYVEIPTELHIFKGTKDEVCLFQKEFGRGILQIKTDRHNVYELSQISINPIYSLRMTKAGILQLCEDLMKFKSKNIDLGNEQIYIWSEQYGQIITNFRDKKLRFQFVFVCEAAQQKGDYSFQQKIRNLLKLRFNIKEIDDINQTLITSLRQSLCQLHQKTKEKCWPCKYPRVTIRDDIKDVYWYQSKIIYDFMEKNQELQDSSLIFEKMKFLRFVQEKFSTKQDFINIIKEQESNQYKVDLIAKYQQDRQTLRNTMDKVKNDFQERLRHYYKRVKETIDRKLKSFDLQIFSLTEENWIQFEAIYLQQLLDGQIDQLVDVLYKYAIPEQRKIINQQLDVLHKDLTEQMLAKGIKS